MKRKHIKINLSSGKTVLHFELDNGAEGSENHKDLTPSEYKEYQHKLKQMRAKEKLFEQFRSMDAEDGSIRSHAHHWCGSHGIAKAISNIFENNDTVEKLVIADHHRAGDKVYKIYTLYCRISDSGKSIVYDEEEASTPQSQLLDYMQFGEAHTASQLAFLIGGELSTIKAQHKLEISPDVYRQPQPTEATQ